MERKKLKLKIKCKYFKLKILGNIRNFWKLKCRLKTKWKWIKWIELDKLNWKFKLNQWNWEWK